MKLTQILHLALPSVEIDWDEPQWVISKDENDVIVLTSGEHDDNLFSGAALPCSAFPLGNVSKKWAKHAFEPLSTELTIKISN